MPGVGTHTTIIQRLAREARDDPAAGDLRTFLTDPDLSAVKGERNRDGTWSRVRRGGAWTDQAWACRSAMRLRFEPERSANHIGFRVALIQGP